MIVVELVCMQKKSTQFESTSNVTNNPLQNTTQNQIQDTINNQLQGINNNQASSGGNETIKGIGEKIKSIWKHVQYTLKKNFTFGKVIF